VADNSINDDENTKTLAFSRLQEEAKAWLPTDEEVQRRAKLAEKNRAKTPSLGVLKTHTGKAIYKAAKEGDLATLQRLSEEWMGNDVMNWANPDHFGRTPLFSASSKGHTDIVKVLVSLPGIDINKADKNDVTPLLVACYKGRTDIVKVLVSLPGIDINKASSNDRTPLGVADNEEIRAILRAKGAR